MKCLDNCLFFVVYIIDGSILMGVGHFRGSPYCSATMLYTSVKPYSLSNLTVDVNNALLTESFRVSATYLKTRTQQSLTNLHLNNFQSSPSPFTTGSSVY